MSIRKTYDKRTAVETTYVYKEITDPETGEIIPSVAEKKKRYKEPPFIRINRHAFYVATEGLGKSAYQILCYFLYKVEPYTNLCKISGAKLAKILGVSMASFNRGMAELKERDIIQSRSYKEWMLNPQIGICCEEEYRVKMQNDYNSIGMEPGKYKVRSEEDDVG